MNYRSGAPSPEKKIDEKNDFQKDFKKVVEQ